MLHYSDILTVIYRIHTMGQSLICTLSFIMSFNPHDNPTWNYTSPHFIYVEIEEHRYWATCQNSHSYRLISQGVQPWEPNHNVPALNCDAKLSPLRFLDRAMLWMQSTIVSPGNANRAYHMPDTAKRLSYLLGEVVSFCDNTWKTLSIVPKP